MAAAGEEDPDRDLALRMLEQFERRLLPGVLRRIGAWKGLPPSRLTELREDVLQELRVDCLTDARALRAMAPRERHARWMQRTERALYRLVRHERRCRPIAEEPTSAPALTSTSLPLPPLVYLHNGRANVLESARAAGLWRRSMRAQLARLAGELGWGRDQRRFWQRRAAEGLIGLAADLLRSADAVRELDAPRNLQLDRRRDRLQRIARRFPVQPATLAVRRALQPWVRRRQPDPPPRCLLRHATALAPELAAGWLWRFEALDRPGDEAEAARSLRRAGRCTDVERSGLVLARARLLERRGQRRRGLAMLQRARARRDPDLRLQRALVVATARPSA